MQPLTPHQIPAFLGAGSASITCMALAARPDLAVTTFFAANAGRRPALAAAYRAVAGAVGASENALAEAARRRMVAGRNISALFERGRRD